LSQNQTLTACLNANPLLELDDWWSRPHVRGVQVRVTVLMLR